MDTPLFRANFKIMPRSHFTPRNPLGTHRNSECFFKKILFPPTREKDISICIFWCTFTSFHLPNNNTKIGTVPNTSNTNGGNMFSKIKKMSAFEIG